MREVRTDGEAVGHVLTRVTQNGLGNGFGGDPAHVESGDDLSELRAFDLDGQNVFGSPFGGKLPHLQLIGRQAEQLTELPQF